MTVYLVGAGPGDPELVTVKGADVLRRADVVVYDRLSVASLLDLAPAGAERISVGKTPRGPSTEQEEINALLIERGKAGQEVVRLKGGDPFVFARGGEEARAPLDAGGLGAVGYAAGPAHRPHDAGRPGSGAHGGARHPGDRRRGRARPGLVRAPAAAGAAGRRDPRPRAGVGARRGPVGSRRRGAR